MESIHAPELEKLFGINLKEGFIALDAATSVLAFEATEISRASFQQFEGKHLGQTFDRSRIS